MKNRILRGEILDSERFLNLATNTERICFISLLLKADDYANMEGSIPRIQRLWRDFGVDSQEKTSKILDALADQDLIRFYKNQKDFEDTFFDLLESIDDQDNFLQIKVTSDKDGKEIFGP